MNEFLFRFPAINDIQKDIGQIRETRKQKQVPYRRAMMKQKYIGAFGLVLPTPNFPPSLCTTASAHRDPK